MNRQLFILTSNGRKAKALLNELAPVLPSRTRVSTEPPAKAARMDSSIVLSILEDEPENKRIRSFAADHAGSCWCLDVYEREPAELTIVRTAGAASLCLFSSERNLAEYRPLAPPEQRLGFLPYPIAERPTVSGEGRAIACAGSPLCEDQMHIVLAAVAETVPNPLVLWMVSQEEEAAAGAMLRRHGLHAELLVGRTLENWEALLARSALAIHLHVSAYGDPGPELALSMMSGVPAVVSDFADGGLLPDAVAVKVSPGERASQELRLMLERLITAPDAAARRVEIAADALGYGMEYFPSRAVAAELLMLVNPQQIGSNLFETELKQGGASV